MSDSTRSRPRIASLVVAVLLVVTSVTAADPTVHVAYLVPSNRTAQTDAVANLEQMMLALNEWFCGQMSRSGHGARTFRYATKADGVTPLIEVVPISETDTYLHEDTWTRVNQAAGNAGVSVWSPGEVWLLVPEIHVQQPDGSIVGGVALGASFGSGDDPGVAIVGSAKLSFASHAGLTDDTPYAGLVVPEIGPYALVQDVSFPWFERTTISSIVSSFWGASMHELGHALGLPHDARHDGNFHGNLMFNGLRGMRGALYPDLYPEDHTRIGYASASLLSLRPYLAMCDAGATSAAIGPPRSHGGPASAGPAALLGPDDQPKPWPTRAGAAPPEADDDIDPTVTIGATGDLAPVDGLLPIPFEATDDVALAFAILQRNGNTIDERVLAGTVVSDTFTTPWFEPGVATNYSVLVIDAAGNRKNANSSITPLAGVRAPQPFARIMPPQAMTGDVVMLDASSTVDPDGASADVLVSWDFDGDGHFDTEPTTEKTATTTYEDPVDALVRLRVTDPDDGTFVSTPIALRIGDSCPADVDGDRVVNVDDLLAVIGAWGVCPGCPEDVNGDDVVDVDDLLTVIGQWGECP